MSAMNMVSRRVMLGALASTVAALWITGFPGTAFSQFVTSRSVGGVWFDTDGVVSSMNTDTLHRLRDERLKVFKELSGELRETSTLRKVSLRKLDAAIGACLAENRPLPDEIKYLAGLQSVQYVFLYPEQNDIVIAGPGEGWTIDARGEVVGLTTGRPVMLLDDLIVALRNASANRAGTISCSIDPTAEGLARLQKLTKSLRTIGSSPQATIASLEQALGRQTISVGGVAADSHFARVLVAADYRMKRLAMGFEPSPVQGLPSYLNMIQAGPAGINNMLPRWWLASHYEPMLADPEGLAWELRGSSVRTMAEEDFLAADGSRKQGGKANTASQKWADNMTSKYDELSLKEPIFGQLRNCMDLAVTAALVEKQDLLNKAGFHPAVLYDATALPHQKYAAPREVDSKASFVKKSNNWVISVSGGVKLDANEATAKHETSDRLAPVRKQAAGSADRWWWN